jgi:hypothetical protein
MAADHHVLEDIHLEEQARVLKGAGNPHAGDLERAPPRDVPLLEADGSGPRLQQAGDDIE